MKAPLELFGGGGAVANQQTQRATKAPPTQRQRGGRLRRAPTPCLQQTLFAEDLQQNGGLAVF